MSGMAKDFFNENKELYWYAHDQYGENPGRAPRYAPHMASVMFEPFIKDRTVAHTDGKGPS